LLAVDTVRFVGEPVAVVITDGLYQGEDAAELVSVDYDPLPVVLGPTAAVADETLLFPAAGTNVAVARAVSTDDARLRPATWSSGRTSSTSGSRASRWRGGPPRPHTRTAS